MELVQAGLLGEAIDEAPVLVFVADENLRYVAVNRYACRLLGYTREELLALTVDQVARYGDAPGEFSEMVAHGVREGVSMITRRGRPDFPFRYRASVVTVARMELYVSVGWPERDRALSAPRRAASERQTSALTTAQIAGTIASSTPEAPPAATAMNATSSIRLMTDQKPARTVRNWTVRLRGVTRVLDHRLSSERLHGAGSPRNACRSSRWLRAAKARSSRSESSSTERRPSR